MNANCCNFDRTPEARTLTQIRQFFQYVLRQLPILHRQLAVSDRKHLLHWYYLFASTTMSSSYPVLQSRPITPHIPSSCSQCHSQFEFPVPTPTPRPSTLLQVRCFKCQKVISHAFYPSQIPGGSGNKSATVGSTSSSHGVNNNGSTPPVPPRRSRKIGTQDRPIETGYYDILGVPVTATTDDIKKAYRT